MQYNFTAGCGSFSHVLDSICCSNTDAIADRTEPSVFCVKSEVFPLDIFFSFFFFGKLHSLLPFYHFPLLAAAVSIQWHLFNADKCLHGVQEEEEQEGRVMGSGGREEEEIRMD